MGDPYTYIRDGEILNGEDGILAKVKSKASEVVNNLKRSLNINKAKTVEEVPDELINNLVSAFKNGALKFKPGLETTRDNSSFKTTSNQSTEINHSTESNKNVTIDNSTKEGSATWKDGGHATFTLGGDPIVDGGAGAYLDADYNISSTRIEKESDPNSGGFNYRGVDVNKSAKGNVKTGGHVEVCGRRLDVPIDVHGEANCGYSHSKEDGTIHYQSTDGNKLMNTTESKYERLVGARAGTSGGLSVRGHSINADAGARFDAGCSVSSKHIDGESLPNIEGYEYEGTETEYTAGAHVNSEAHLNASANVLGKTAGLNTTGKLKADGQVRCSHLNFKEKSSTSNETSERRVFHKVRAEGSGEFEASVNGNAFLGDKSKDFRASVKGKSRGSTEATLAEWDYTKNKEGFTGHFEALSAEAEGEAELDASIGSKSVKMMANGRVAAKAVDATADLTVKKDENKTSIGGIHANIGNISARGKAGIKLPGIDEKSVEAEAEFKLASVNALQAEVRDKEHCDEADIHVKSGFVNANIGNAKVVGEKTGKKATMSMDNTFAELNAGNVSITGIDNRESNRTGVNARIRTTHTANIGNVDITGLGSRETRFEANTAPGVDAFNFRCGIHRNTGGSVSTNRTSVCNVDLTIGPPNWNISFGNSVGNIAIPFFGGGGSGGGGGSSSRGANPNQSGGGDDEDDTSENQQNGGDSRNGNGTGTGGNGTGTGRDGTGTGGNGTGTGRNGTGTGRNGTGTGGNGTGTGGNGTGTGTGMGRDGTGTGRNGTGTGRNGTGTGGNGTGTGTGTGMGRDGTGTGRNGAGENSSGRSGNGNGTGHGGNGTGRLGNGAGRTGNGTGTGGNGTGTSGNSTGINENGIGRSGNDTSRNRNGTGINGNGTGTGRNGTGTVRIENCTGTCRNGLIGQPGDGRNGNGTSGNGTVRKGNDTGRKGNDTGRNATGKNGNGRNGTGTVRNGNVTGKNGTGTVRKGNGTGNGLNGQPGVGDVGKKPKLNLRDTADQNRMLAELVGNNFTKPSGNPRRSMRNQSHGATPMDWSNAEKIEEHLYKTYNPNYTPDDKQSGTSQSGSRDSRKSKPQLQKQPPQKPTGSNKNIHTIFTIGAGDSKPIQKLSNNVYGFGNDE